MNKTIIVILTFVLTGCTLKPEGLSYYQFNYAHQSQLPASVNPQKLVIEKPRLLGMLNNQGIAMRYDTNRLKNANYHLWSGDPGTMLMNLAQYSMVDIDWTALTRFQFQPLSNSNLPYYQLSWQLDHFNGTMDGTAEIAGQWQLYYHYNDSSSVLLSVNNFSSIKSLDSPGYESLVTLLQDIWREILVDTKPVLRPHLITRN